LSDAAAERIGSKRALRRSDLPHILGADTFGIIFSLKGRRGMTARIMTGAALALLVWSFALDVRWLHRQRAVSAVGSFP